MYLLSGGSIFTGKLIQALCWMLVHSLWQGILLAGLVGLIVLFTKKQSAAVRYNLVTSALVMFIAAISVTFYLQVKEAFPSTNLIAQNTLQASATTPAAIINAPFIAENNSFIGLLTGFFNQYATAIVFIWFLVIGVKLAQMAAGLYGIQEIRKRKVKSVGSYWNLRVQQLSTQMKIKSPVQFLQSGIVKVPMVIGYFKPVIFFPIGALASLSPADVEAILMHELAHIRRKDYLVNMLQHLVEILFFFNPAVLWVSAIIKTERENCCDDIALAQTNNNKRDYINALVSFQEFDEAQPRYATALTGKKDHLLQRVKRIVNNNNKSLNNMEKIFLIVCFLLTGTLTVVFSQSEKNKKSNSIMVQQKYHSLTTEATEEMEKAFASTTAYREHEPKQNEWILLDTPKNAKLFAEQQLVMAQQQKLAAEQQKLVGQQQKIAAEDQKRAMTDSSLNENDRKKMAEQNNVLDQQKKKLDEQKAELEHQKKLMDEDKKKAEDKRNEIKNKNLTTTVHTNTNVNIERVVDYAKGYTFTGLSYAVNANDDATSGHKYKNTAEKNLNVEQLNNNVITDLKVNNIISTTTNLSYQLTNDQLIVNDKIQPVAIQQQLKAKYIKNPDWKLMYNFKLK